MVVDFESLFVVDQHLVVTALSRASSVASNTITSVVPTAVANMVRFFCVVYVCAQRSKLTGAFATREYVREMIDETGNNNFWCFWCFYTRRRGLWCGETHLCCFGHRQRVGLFSLRVTIVIYAATTTTIEKAFAGTFLKRFCFIDLFIGFLNNDTWYTKATTTVARFDSWFLVDRHVRIAPFGRASSAT